MKKQSKQPQIFQFFIVNKHNQVIYSLDYLNSDRSVESVQNTNRLLNIRDLCISLNSQELLQDIGNEELLSAETDLFKLWLFRSFQITMVIIGDLNCQNNLGQLLRKIYTEIYIPQIKRNFLHEDSVLKLKTFDCSVKDVISKFKL